MKKKKKDGELKFPSLLKRVFPTLLYNVILSALIFFLTFRFLTLDSIAYELDYFLMYGIFFLRWQIFHTVILSFLFLRQVCKDINFIIFTIMSAQHDKDVIAVGGYKRIYDGIEGVGKTLNVTNDAVLLACDKDEQMRFEYYIGKAMGKTPENSPEFKVLKQSFDFYKNNPDKIPHLISSYKIEYDGKKSYPFDLSYLDQKIRPPESAVMALSELGQILPNSLSRMPTDPKKDKNNILKKNETLSKSRQWFDLTIVSDEQRMGETVLYFRSVCGSGKSLSQRETVLKPIFLDILTRFLRKRVLKKKDKTKRGLARLYLISNKLSRSIGFYDFIYKDRDVISGSEKSKDLHFVIPRFFLFKYDTRGERENYPLLMANPQ